MDISNIFKGSSGGASTQRTLVFVLMIVVLMPVALTIFTGLNATAIDSTTKEVLDDFDDFAGSKPTKEAVWVLKGIYTAYGGGTVYGYTPDGWLYGSVIQQYSPSQYNGSAHAYTVERSDDGFYRYLADTPNGDHSAGDLYTSVTMDVAEQSTVFFTENGRVDVDEWFYYSFNGFRYSFGPLAAYNAVNRDGESVPVSPTTTSLSLIWYNYYNGYLDGNTTGISGQLIIGTDRGVAYLDAATIIRGFNQTTSTSKFTLKFNDVDMNIYIRINPYYLAQTGSIETCYNMGYWELQVTSMSTDVNAYVGTDFKFNVTEIFFNALKLFTFNAADLGITGWVAIVLSIVYSIPLYAGFIAIGLEHYGVLIGLGLVQLVSSIASIFL